jgi:hypothetical protein
MSTESSAVRRCTKTRGTGESVAFETAAIINMSSYQIIATRRSFIDKGMTNACTTAKHDQDVHGSCSHHARIALVSGTEQPLNHEQTFPRARLPRVTLDSPTCS